ncbi:hypothetical protein RINTU1_13230 [Candidatus Regiella insecticola]|uniref:Uncharacterized protein n=1 Tax=Candidatus Regiella insecticola TaxID=138073 RepID=A0A6L2ZM57_9ENTR|nr:hypothetical protein RINTU1_13230 [Candidatus Regiella insecticola]
MYSLRLLSYRFKNFEEDFEQSLGQHLFSIGFILFQRQSSNNAKTTGQ